jgi:hypothetical protein
MRNGFSRLKSMIGMNQPAKYAKTGIASHFFAHFRGIFRKTGFPPSGIDAAFTKFHYQTVDRHSLHAAFKSLRELKGGKTHSLLTPSLLP